MRNKSPISIIPFDVSFIFCDLLTFKLSKRIVQVAGSFFGNIQIRCPHPSHGCALRTAGMLSHTNRKAHILLALVNPRPTQKSSTTCNINRPNCAEIKAPVDVV